MKILTFAGSLRKDSLNKKLSHVALNFVKTNQLADIEFCDLQTLQIPVYDGDLETALGLPAGVVQLCQKISEAQALIVCTPEYNGSIPGILKNTIDWISRQKPNPLAGKHILILAASPGALGGVRSLWHTRVPFEVLGAHVYPEMMGVPKAHEAFSADLAEGLKLIDPKLSQNLEKLIKEFIAFASK